MSHLRDRAWRRFKNHTKNQTPKQRTLPFEKNWKHLYTRPVKRYRAKQLGFDYPIKSTRQLLDQELPL